MRFLTGVSLRKGGDSMSYGYGRGLGFRGTSPPWPYVGRGKGGLPRCHYPGLSPRTVTDKTTRVAPLGHVAPQEEELQFLKKQAEIMKRHLGEIERRIQKLDEKD